MQIHATHLLSVIPAKAGIQKLLISHDGCFWTPASAGVTIPFRIDLTGPGTRAGWRAHEIDR
jgi:hypothetical protein